MSFLIGGGGCGLCGTQSTDPTPTPRSSTMLSSEELQEIILPILSTLKNSSELTPANDNLHCYYNGFDWTVGAELKVSRDSVIFCPDCQSLLKETKRLQDLAKVVASQLDAVVAKVKAKFVEKITTMVPLVVESEVIINQDGTW